ncbi:flagellar biosynthesis repressor FlbT [Azospirillum sp. SYSU D00513]|uniref:flagellar biosynthesis repressor FlbT n=1 Tax=Azospirillum sp. SYSU D00513 TaxID=2812561 RepID=UPI001A96B13A|nr:flagellar biosynthesis repressor FlbT [Azospirillum sp. SYSU D00513]
MSLRIKLAPYERFVVNGVGMQNGRYRSELQFHSWANVLREKDLIDPAGDLTPGGRVYLAVQMMILDPSGHEAYVAEFEHRKNELLSVNLNPDINACLERAGDLVAGNDLYKALGQLRSVIKFEQLLLNHSRLREAMRVPERLMAAE